MKNLNEWTDDELANLYGNITDLEWLHKKYYLPLGYKFAWPKTQK